MRTSSNKKRAELAYDVGRIAALASALLLGARLLTRGLANPAPAVALGACAVGFTVAALAARFRPERSWPLVAIPAIGAVGTAALAAAEGGLASEALYWTPLVPLLAGLLCGRGAIGFFALFEFLVWTAFAALKLLRPETFPEDSAMIHLRFASGIGALAFGSYLAWRHERSVEAAEARERKLGTDPLTGLASAAGFEHRVRESFARSKRRQTDVAVIALYVTGADESLGRAGSALIREVASRLLEQTRVEEPPSHFGSGEFALMIEDRNAKRAAERVSARLGRALAEPVEIEPGREIECVARIGIAARREDDDAPGIIGRALGYARYREPVKRSARISGSPSRAAPEPVETPAESGDDGDDQRARSG